MIGSDEGAGKGVTREGAIRKEVKNPFFFAHLKKDALRPNERTDGQIDGQTQTDRPS